MKQTEEDMIYDAMNSIAEYSKPLCGLINSITDIEQKQIYSRAYKDGVYSPAIRLQLMLSDEAMQRGKERHEKLNSEVREYFANKARVIAESNCNECECCKNLGNSTPSEMGVGCPVCGRLRVIAESNTPISRNPPLQDSDSQPPNTTPSPCPQS